MKLKFLTEVLERSLSSFICLDIPRLSSYFTYIN
jgi:hypothetical protein